MDAYLHGVSGRMAEQLGIKTYHILSNPQWPNSPIERGLGVIGKLPAPMPFEPFLRMVKSRFQAPYLRYTRPLNPEVQTIALCGGAGAEFAEEAIAQGADVFITADVKYHEMQAADGRIALVDMDHWVSEHFTRNIFQDLLQPHLLTYISTADHTPVNLL